MDNIKELLENLMELIEEGGWAKDITTDSRMVHAKNYLESLDLPETVGVLDSEGGTWRKFRKWDGKPAERNCVHAVLFSNGAVWDCLNGWRPASTWRNYIVEKLKNEQ